MIASTHTDSNIPIQTTVDTQGLRCPEPLMQLHVALNSIQSGENVRFIADDPASWRDAHAMCNFLAHSILHTCRKDNYMEIIIQKRKE